GAGSLAHATTRVAVTKSTIRRIDVPSSPVASPSMRSRSRGAEATVIESIGLLRTADALRRRYDGPMRCPACKADLQQVPNRTGFAAACASCYGMWLDNA